MYFPISETWSSLWGSQMSHTINKFFFDNYFEYFYFYCKSMNLFAKTKIFSGVTLAVQCNVWKRLIWLWYILLSIYLPISSIWWIDKETRLKGMDSIEEIW